MNDAWRHFGSCSGATRQGTYGNIIPSQGVELIKEEPKSTDGDT